MKETSFINQNKEKWQRFEKLRKDGNANPDELSDLFVEITDDLSYARTFYPRRSVRVYLNNLAQSVFNSLYKLKKDPFGNFLRFWKTGLPVEMYHARKQMLAAFVIFIVSMAIGVISIFDDINFARIILGDNYVDTTNYFISEGDPMRIYKLEDELPMFIRIFFNNIMVAFQSFVFGVVFCIGTGIVLISNGIMLGTFQSYFYLRSLTLGSSLFYTSLLTIWIHGTFEILAIVTAGGAGLVVGMSLLNPGTYTRGQSFQIGMKRGVKIMLGLTPFIFFAAFLEGYVTRLTEMPDWSRLLIILGCLAIFVFYFMIYPFIVVRKNRELKVQSVEPIFRQTREIELFKIKNVNEVVSDSFMMFRRVFLTMSRWIWLVLVPLQLILAYFIFIDNSQSLEYHDLYPSELLYNLIKGGKGSAFYFICNAFLFSIIISAVILILKKMEKPEIHLTFKMQAIRLLKWTLLFVPFTAIGLSCFFIKSNFGFFLFLLITPLLIYIPVSITGSMRKTAGSKFSGAVFSFFTHSGNIYGLFFISAIVLTSLFLLFNTILFYFLDTVVQWHTITMVDNYGVMINFVHTAFIIVFIQLFFLFIGVLFTLYHYVVIETDYSISLFEAMKKFGTISKTHESYRYNE